MRIASNPIDGIKHKVRLIRDKLYIDNQLYDEEDPYFEYLRKPLAGNSYNPENRRRDNASKYGGYRNSNSKTESSNSHNSFNPGSPKSQAYDLDSRKYVTAGRVPLNPPNIDNVDFRTPNIYNKFQECSIEESPMPARNKTKATSPLVDERENKKSREGSTSDDTNTSDTRQSQQNVDDTETDKHEMINESSANQIVVEAAVYQEGNQPEMEIEKSTESEDSITNK